MRSPRSDVVIIGGGPAGSKAAELLSGRDVTVIEEHAVSGRPVQCTGLISDEVVRLSGVRTDILNSLYGARVHFPDGTVVSARSKERKAVLIDRSEMDSKMAAKAMDSGAKFEYGTRYLGHSISDGRVSIRTDAGDMSADIIIGADGHSSPVSASLRNNGPKEYVRGIQVDVRHRSDDAEMIDIFLGSHFAPGFFAWSIPFEDRMRVGLCSSFNALPPSEYLGNILRKTGLQDRQVVHKYSGKIPLGGRSRSYSERLLLIGDAAGQVKPISGGGLYPAFVSSYCLRDTVDEAFGEDDFSGHLLSRYERRWKDKVGTELRNGYRLRRIFRRMDDRCLNDVSRLLRNDRAAAVLDTISIDRPSDIALPILKNVPLALRTLPIIFRAIVGDVR